MLVADPLTGGSIASSDGSLTLRVPAAEADAYTFNLASADDAPAFSNLRVGSHSYVLSAVDSTGALVTTFDPPLTVVVGAGPCTVQVDGNDWSSAGVYALDPATGAFGNLVSTVDPDANVLTASLPRIAPAPARPPTDAAGVVDESGQIARQTIDQIATGDYEDLPPPQLTGDCSGGAATVAAVNGTDYSLSLYFAGIGGQSVTLGAGVTLNLQLPPGHYDVAASVPAPDVTPFLGVWDLENCSYAFSALIVTAHAPTASVLPSPPYDVPDTRTAVVQLMDANAEVQHAIDRRIEE
jgi:hypothetical protein